MKKLSTVRVFAAWLAALFVSGAAIQAYVRMQPTGMEVGIIDFFGGSKISQETLRGALTIKEGHSISFNEPPVFIEESRRRLTALPGVVDAQLTIVCCEESRAIVYVGVHAAGDFTSRFAGAPTGAVRLDDDVVQAGRQFEQALTSAVRRGQGQEDDTQGHSLAIDPDTRGAQQRFLVIASRDDRKLRTVLRESADAEHRALAAVILGYAGDKQSAVDDLVRAVNDPAEGVRNNAMRSLLVFTMTEPTATRPVPKVPYEPFVGLLNSPIWSDRNKSSHALSVLTKNRDPKLLALLRTEAMVSLVEMARWKSVGHAGAALTILGRMAGLPDDVVQQQVMRGEREPIIAAALTPG